MKNPKGNLLLLESYKNERGSQSFPIVLSFYRPNLNKTFSRLSMFWPIVSTIWVFLNFDMLDIFDPGSFSPKKLWISWIEKYLNNNKQTNSSLTENLFLKLCEILLIYIFWIYNLGKLFKSFSHFVWKIDSEIHERQHCYSLTN